MSGLVGAVGMTLSFLPAFFSTLRTHARVARRNRARCQRTTLA
ncbi:hypothetical protein AB0J90_20365 [Micromonospora sp. NPDC049523]